MLSVEIGLGEDPPSFREDLDAAGRIGSVLGNYKLLAVLGSGAMGAVYCGQHVTLGRLAAVKVLHSDIARDPGLVTRFMEEARAANLVKHPGLVDVEDIGTSGGPSAGLHYLVMELLHGETLGAKIARVGKLPYKEAVRIVHEAAEALFAAHAAGVVHRDLKPENLFLVKSASGSETVKILDFGVAKLTGRDAVRHTRTGAVVGTPVYMSPEQCLGARDVDARSDVYSLGVVLFEALTGRPPFLDDTVGRLILAHTQERPPPIRAFAPQVPVALEDAVMCALAKVRDDRPADMREFARSLVDALQTHTAPHLLFLPRNEENALDPEHVERIERNQTQSVAARLHNIIKKRLASDQLRIPSMPHVVTRALALTRNEAVGLDRVASVVESDPLLVPRLLKLANSAAFRGAYVNRVDHAVTRIGARNMQTFLTESAARSVFSSRDPATARAFKSVWEHCVVVATLGRALASDNKALRVSADEVYLAGLLHDVGKPIVGALLLETERNLLDELGTPWIGVSLWQKVVEQCHRSVGEALAKRWELPASVAQAIAHGVEELPQGAHGNDIAPWLAYAHSLAVTHGFGGGAPDYDKALSTLVRARIELEGTEEREREALALLGDVLAVRAPRLDALAAVAATDAGNPRAQVR